MTLSDLITTIKQEKPSQNSDATLLRWINELEMRIQESLNVPRDEWITYTLADGSEELIMPAPYDNVYLTWLKAKIDYVNQDFESYSNYQAMFNAEYTEAKAFAYRTGMFDPQTWPDNFSKIF